MTSRQAGLRALKYAAILFVLAVLYYVLRHIGFDEILAAILEAPPSSIAAAAGLYLVVFVLWTWRWQQFMDPSERPGLHLLFPIYMAGVFGNCVTPGARTGGEPIRVHYMMRAFGGQISAHFGTVLADKLANGAIFFCFLAVSAWFVTLFVPMPAVLKAILVAATALAALAVVSGYCLRRHIGPQSRAVAGVLCWTYNLAPLRFLRRRFPTFQHFEDYATERLQVVLEPLARAAVTPRTRLRVLLISVAAEGALYAANYVLFRGLGADVRFVEVLIIVTISMFFGDIAISPAGAGFAETAMIGLCRAFGVEPHTAAAATLISRGLFYFYGLGLGGACLLCLSAAYGRRR